METPGAPERGADRTLYGDGGDSINRRRLIGGLAALVVASPAAAAARDVSRLWWRGRAHVEVGGRALDLLGETSLQVPLLQVRSTTYIVDQGPGTARTLILEPDGAWLEQGGARKPLPAQLGIHERMQYAIYAWLLFLQQARPLKRQMARARGRKIRVTSPPWPDAMFEIGADGYPIAAEWTVEDAEPGKPPVAQRIAFSGRIDDNGVRWPRRFELTRQGKPYFTLDVTAFRAS